MLLREISAKLDRVLRLLAVGAIPPDGTDKEKAIALSRAGLAPKEIAELLDTTPNTVSVALSKARRGKRTKNT